MNKASNIYITITNNVVNFKVRIPWEWCKEIGITEKEKGINIRYENNNLFIKKTDNVLFSDLSVNEKILQINKYKYLYRNNYDRQKDFFKDLEKYFNITYRTAYRYLSKEILKEDLDKVELLSKQIKHTRNVNLMLQKGVESITVILTIPSALAIVFLQGKTSEELGIKNIIEIYDKNTSIPINMSLDNNNKQILLSNK